MKAVLAIVALTAASAYAEDSKIPGPAIPMDCALADADGFIEPGADDKAARICKGIFDIKVKNSAGKKVELFAKHAEPKMRIEVVNFGREKKDPALYRTGNVAMPIEQSVDTIDLRIIVDGTIVEKAGLNWGNFKDYIGGWASQNYAKIQKQ